MESRYNMFWAAVWDVALHEENLELRTVRIVSISGRQLIALSF